MIGLPTRAPLPLAFVPPVVAMPAANAIVPFALPSGGALVAGPGAAISAGAAGAAIVAGAPVVASLAVGFGVGVLLGAALLAAAQLWGQLNGKGNRVRPVDQGFDLIEMTGRVSTTGPTQLDITSRVVSLIEFDFVNGCQGPSNSSRGDLLNLSTGTRAYGFRIFRNPQAGPCSASSTTRWEFQYATDSAKTAWTALFGHGGAVASILNVSFAINFKATGPNSVPAGALVDTEVEPLPNRPYIDKTFVTPDSIPRPLPLPLPGVSTPDNVPDAQPITQPTPQAAPGQQPVRVPVLPRAPVYSPQAPTQTQQTTKAGTLVAPAPAPVPTTDPEAHFPFPGSGPITGQGVRPDLQAIASEVGRIEQKVASLMNPNQGDATDRLQLLWQRAESIYNALTDGAPADTYTLSSPCVKDENGDRIVTEVQIPETSDNWTRITARVDALAELLQVHKDLKQPNCHIPPVEVGGEFVTVNFEQID